MFIHGRVRLDSDEWCGFEEAITGKSDLVGVRIRDEPNWKLFRYGRSPLLRTLAYIGSEKSCAVDARMDPAAANRSPSAQVGQFEAIEEERIFGSSLTA